MAIDTPAACYQRALTRIWDLCETPANPREANVLTDKVARIAKNTLADAAEMPGELERLRTVNAQLLAELHHHFGCDPECEKRHAEITVVEGDWLWRELMDWCLRRRVRPADYNDLFAIVGRARQATTSAEPARCEYMMQAVIGGATAQCKLRYGHTGMHSA